MGEQSAPTLDRLVEVLLDQPPLDWPTYAEEDIVGSLWRAGLRAEHIPDLARAVADSLPELMVLLAERLADRSVEDAERREHRAEDLRQRAEKGREIQKIQEMADKSLRGLFDGAAVPADWATMDADELDEAVDAHIEKVKSGK
jgi:hypothetical protein